MILISKKRQIFELLLRRCKKDATNLTIPQALDRIMSELWDKLSLAQKFAATYHCNLTSNLNSVCLQENSAGIVSLGFS